MKIMEIVSIVSLLMCVVFFFIGHSFSDKGQQGGVRGPCKYQSFDVDHPHYHDLIHQQNDTIFALAIMLRECKGKSDINSEQEMHDLVTAIRGASSQIEDNKSQTIDALNAEVTRLKQGLSEMNSKYISALTANANERDKNTVRDMNMAISMLQEEVVSLKHRLMASHTSTVKAEGTQ